MSRPIHSTMLPPGAGRRGAGDRPRSRGRGGVRVRGRAAVGQDRARAVARARRSSRGWSPRRAAPPIRWRCGCAITTPSCTRRTRRSEPRRARCSTRWKRPGSRRSARASMGGVRANLTELTEARVRGDAIIRARNAEEVPLATAVGLIARERLTGEAPPKAALAGLKLVAPWIEEKAGAELDALALTLDDQAAFAKLVAAPARGPRPRRGRGPVRTRSPTTAATTTRATTAATTRAPTRATRARPPAATWSGAARKPRTGRDEEQGSDEMEAGDERSSPGDELSESALGRGRPPQLGARRRRPTTRPSPPASTRSSRPRSCATRRSSAGCAPISTSRWRARRASSPGSPTGCSGG